MEIASPVRGHGDPSEIAVAPIPARSGRDRLLTATRWCATIIGLLQLLLAGLLFWILVDLHQTGAPITRFAFAFAVAFFDIQLAVLFFAWTLPRNRRVSLCFLAAVYLAGLAILGALALFQPDLRPWILQPGAVLPPNEIMGRDWPLAVAMGAFDLAQLLGLLPLLLVIAVLVRGSK